MIFQLGLCPSLWPRILEGNLEQTYICSDPNNFNGGWREYMRIRVELDVRKALRMQIMLRRQNGDSFVVQLRYERLPPFCFTCGRLGHTDRRCDKPPQFNTRELKKGYGPWLRAANRRQQWAQIGERWLRDKSPEKAARSGDISAGQNTAM